MTKRLSILFAFVLLFQTFASSLLIPVQVFAENHENQSSFIKDVQVIDEEGSNVTGEIGSLENDTPVTVKIVWDANGVNFEDEREFTSQLPEEIQIDSQDGNLGYDGAEIGTYTASKEGKVTLKANEAIVELPEAQGEVIIDGTYVDEAAEIAESKQTESEDNQEKDVEAKETTEEADKSKEQSKEEDVVSEDEVEESSEENEDKSEKLESENKNSLQADREPAEITENIIEDMRLMYKDGPEFKEGELIDVDEDLRFELDWSLTNNKDYVAGDYFEFKLPEQLTVYNPLDGSLGDYGTYTVDMDGNVKFTFNEKVEQESNIKGTFWFDTELKEKEITSTEETIELVINGEVVEKVVVNVKPTDGQAISKDGQPVDGNFNTEEVEWTVVVNTTRESLKNAIVDDLIKDGQELMLDSLKLSEVEVDLAGKVTQELEEVTGFENNSTKDNLNIELGDTNKAYKLTFKTELLEKEFKEGTTNYKNDAILKSDGKEDAKAGGSVSVSRPKSMEKTSSAFDKEDRSIEWTVNANFTEQYLKKDEVITDEFTFTVDKKELDDVFEINKENISIEQVDKFDKKGKATETSNAKNLFDITIDGNKVTYKLKEASNKAFILKYKTELKDGAYINKDGKITNEIELNGKTATGSQGVVQQVGKKTNAGINYEDKTIDWTITVNADKQDLRNIILTDDFSGTGQKLVKDSIKITPASGATVTPHANNEGFKIDFGNIKETYTIKYQTKFTYDFEGDKTPDFKNGVNITYETSDNSEYELEFGNTVKPNKETKSNGAKNGDVNQETKEITWKVDVNYNELALDDAKLKDAIPGNQSLIEGSVKIYETSIGKKGVVTKGKDVTDQFTLDANENQVNVDFGKINKSYRVEFKTKDKDGIYNSDEEYTNTAEFIPRDGEKHNLTANVTLPNQGEFLGKSGTHNKEDWTIDWKVDVNKSHSTTSDFTITDDLGDPAAQILLEDTIKVTKAGSSGELTEGDDYELTVDGNKFEIYIPGEITEAYEVTYSSYIVAEETGQISNDAEIQSNEVIEGTTDQTEEINVKISTVGGTGEGMTGSLVLKKSETDSERALKDVAFSLIKTVKNKDIVVREGVTDDNGQLEWKGLKHGKYTLKEEVPEGYLGEAEQEVELSSEDAQGIKTLSIENERETGTAKIIKVDSVTGDTLENATFELTNQTTGQQYEVTTEGDGVVEEEIPFGEYTVEETTAPDGYRITGDIDNITVDIDETTEITVENVAFVNVAGEKTWHADEDTQLPESITVKLLANNKAIDEKVITSSDDWEYSFEDLDKYSRANKAIDYDIEEVEIDGYLSEKDGYDLTNIETTKVQGTKTWVDDNNPDRPKSITVQLLANGEKLEDKTVKVTEAANWVYNFTDLPKYDVDGEKITYTIEELDVEGYKSEIDGYDIENVRKATTSVEGEKTWKDEDATDRPKSIDVNLTREVKGVTDKDFTKTQTVKPDDTGDWKYEFEDLDEFDENGIAYTYIIEENNVPEKYESIIDGHDITNVRVGETEVSGTKRWKDDKVEDRPDEITVNLLRNKVVIDSKEVTSDDNWKYEFTKLDKYDKDGKYYNYKIKEEQVPGYAPEITGHDITNTRSEKTSIDITKGWLDNDSEDRLDSVIVYVYQNDELFDTVKVKASNDWEYELTNIEAYDEDGQPYKYTIAEKAIEGYESTVDGFNITNLRVGETEISGTKTWKDADDSDRPESITVNLLQNGKEIDSKEVTKEDDWAYKFTELDKYDDQGVAYGYTIDEEPVKGYEKSGNGTDLTNTRTGVTDVTGEKIWQDNDNATKNRPDEITVKLLQNGKLFTQTEITKDDNWKYSFEHLPAYDDEGLPYGYTVDEVDVDGYTKSAGENNDIVNTRTGTTDIAGEKIWQDNDDATGDRPKSVTVQLLQNGEIVAETETTADDNWTYSFDNVERFDENGVEWGYTVDEVDVDGYAKSAGDNHNLVNTRTGTTDITGEKIWQDNNDATGDRPESITVQLLRNGEVVAETETTADDNWTYSFDNVERFDENGVEWGYTVDEVDVDGYTKSVGENNDLINTRTGTTEVTVDKSWKDEESSDRPDTITVNLMQNGTFLKSVAIEADDNWSHTFTDLSEFDEQGKAYKYTVTEHDVPGYESKIDGFDITNTRTDEKSIEIMKSWLDDNSDERPDSIGVELFRSIADGDKESVGTYEVTVEDDWLLEIDKLPAFDRNGKAYTYEIEEEAVEGYESEVNGFDITNLRVGETEISGVKTWKDADKSDRPDSITVNLLQNGEKVDSKEVTTKDNWKYSFNDLAEFDEDGAAYDYTIKEESVDGYESIVDGFDVTNVRTDNMDLDIVKTWKDQDDTNRPSAIKVDLLQNGQLFKTVELTEEKDWIYHFKDLDQFDDQGLAYEYSVIEHAVENYVSEVKEQDTGFEIINTLKDPEKPTTPEDPEQPDEGDEQDTSVPGKPGKPILPGNPGDSGIPGIPNGNGLGNSIDSNVSGDVITPGQSEKPGTGGVLPKTATNTFTFILLGALLMIGGITLLFVRRKKASNES